MKQLDPKSVWLFFIPSVISTTILFIFLGFSLATLLFAVIDSVAAIITIVFLMYVLFLVLAFIWSKLIYRFYKYELIENGFRKESGIINKKYTTIPYDRIQNVDINRGILARILGLSDLHIQTAGASASFGRYGATGIYSEGRLPGLSKEVAEALRDELIQRSRNSKGQQGL
jgi:uncharacterized membrane protein YdbT with pleckstrin-like domain